MKAIYGHEPILGQLPQPLHDAHVELDNWLQKSLLKYDVDKTRTFREFVVGESLYLKLQPHAETYVVNKRFSKSLREVL